MKEIKWKPEGSRKYAKAKIGQVELCCFWNGYSGPKRRWYANVYIEGSWITTNREGELRKSLSKAKEDTIELARDLLLDYHASILQEMKHFDITE